MHFIVGSPCHSEEVYCPILKQLRLCFPRIFFQPRPCMSLPSR